MSRPLGRKAFKGRGALLNPAGRFERRNLEEVHDGWYVEEQPDTIATTVEPDRARGIITTNRWWKAGSFSWTSEASRPSDGSVESSRPC